MSLQSWAVATKVHAANDPGLREPVVVAYRDVLDNHPLAAPDISRDLISWQQWDLSQKMRHLQPLIAERDPLGAYAVKRYLQRAESGKHPIKNDPSFLVSEPQRPHLRKFQPPRNPN